MIVYSEKDHRGNELLKNSGKGASTDSPVNKIQWGDLENWTPSDASAGGLTLTINSANKTKVGKFVLVQFDITYPTNSNGSNASVGGMPDSCASTIQSSLISISTLGFQLKGVISGTSCAIKDAATDVAVTNLSLSGKRILLTTIYLAASL